MCVILRFTVCKNNLPKRIFTLTDTPPFSFSFLSLRFTFSHCECDRWFLFYLLAIVIKLTKVLRHAHSLARSLLPPLLLCGSLTFKTSETRNENSPKNNLNTSERFVRNKNIKFFKFFIVYSRFEYITKSKFRSTKMNHYFHH